VGTILVCARMLLSVLIRWAKIVFTLYSAVSCRFSSCNRESASCRVDQSDCLSDTDQLQVDRCFCTMEKSLETKLGQGSNDGGKISMTPKANNVVPSERARRTPGNTDIAKSLTSPHGNDTYYVHPSAGYVAHDCNYKCVWQNYNGAMVAGTTAIVFTGSFFLFEKTIVLQWDNIRQVVLMDGCNMDSNDRNNNNNNGIEIILTDNTVHSFVMNNIQNAMTVDKVWLTLLSLHNDALFGRQASPQRDDIVATPRTFKRRNSDPASQSTTASSLFSPSYDNDDAEDGHAVDIAGVGQNLDYSNRPVIRSVTSMADSVSQDVIMFHAGTPLRLQPIHCIYGSTAGRLYIGNTAIFFTGKRSYFWEHLTVTIPWTTVRRIQVLETKALKSPAASMETSNGADDSRVGLSITTKDGAVRTDGGTIDHEATIFEFCKMETPDRVWASLVSIQNEKLLSIASTPQASSTLPTKSMTTEHHPRSSVKQRRKSHRRMNSDPMLASQLNFDFSAEDAIELKNAADAEERDDTHRVKFADADANSKMQSVGANCVNCDSSYSFSDAWTSMKNQATTTIVYDKIVVSNHELQNCTVGQFYEAFMADNATFSLARFLEQRGDYELRSTAWENISMTTESVENVAPQQQKRVVKYMHPVNVPMAPPQAGARKEQTLRRYGDVGIVVETQTFVDNVPMTDCFYVADRVSAEASNNNSVTVTIEFGITFVKSTMFKGIISKKTAAEFTAHCKAMAQYMTDAVEVNPITLEDMRASMNIEGIIVTEDKPKVDIKHATAADAQQSQPSSKTTWLSLDRILLLFLVLIQIWILMEIRGLKYMMGKFEQPQQRLTTGDHLWEASKSDD
jgi:VAD1 Analog of StAR-related lipid transfer domain